MALLVATLAFCAILLPVSLAEHGACAAWRRLKR